MVVEEWYWASSSLGVVVEGESVVVYRAVQVEDRREKGDEEWRDDDEDEDEEEEEGNVEEEELVHAELGWPLVEWI